MGATEENEHSILIPVRESDQWVEVFVDELPEDVNDIIDILRAELAPLSVWLRFAVEYYRQGKMSMFQDILITASEPGVEKIYHDEESRISRIKILNALAGHYINQMWSEKDEARRNAFGESAIKFIQRADRIDSKHPLNLTAKGAMFLASNDDRSRRFFRSVYHSNQENLQAILGTALLQFRDKKYAEARDMYEKAIRLHPNCPAEHASRLRLCYGICCYKMESYRKAEAAMKRAAELDQSNVDALMARALALLRRLDPKDRLKKMRDPESKFIAMIHRAHLVDNQSPSVLNHLANHMFVQWNALPGAFSVVQGSPVVYTKEDMRSEVEPGQILRIGDGDCTIYVSTEDGSVTSESITLDIPYPYASNSSIAVFSKQYEQMVTLAGKAFHTTQSPEITAESCFLMGRVAHARGNYSEAYKYYFNAVKVWPEFSLAWYFLAQMYYQQGVAEKTEVHLEKSLHQYPDCIDVLMLLAQVNRTKSEKNAKKNALMYLRRALEFNPGCVAAQIDCAEILQLSRDEKDTNGAITCYRAAEQILQEANRTVPSELFVNLGILYHRTGSYAEAASCYSQALAATRESGAPKASSKEPHACGENEVATEKNVSILYNVALLHESHGHQKAAEIIFTSIRTTFPRYVDAILRLGCIYRDQGLESKAIKMFEEALKVNPNCADACALIANIHMKKRVWNKAQRKFEALMGMKHMKNDPYALLAMGNIYISNLDDRLQKNLDLSQEYFRKVLSLQPNNLYAANGVGIVLAESGNLEGAKQVFSRVREADPNLPDAWINLAHIHLAEERYPEAVQLYSMCLSQCYNGLDAQVMLYLAKAYYEWKKYELCITTLKKAIALKPTDLQLWYNLGLCQEEYAISILAMDTSNPDSLRRTLADVEGAVGNVQHAERIFLLLSGKHIKSNVGFDKVKAKEHAAFCADTGTKADVHLNFERARVQQRTEQAEFQRRMVAELREKREKEEAEKKRMEEEVASKRREIAQRKQDRLAELAETWHVKARETQEQEIKKKEAAASRKRKKKAVSSDEEGDQDGEKRVKTAREEEDLFGSSSESENEVETKQAVVEAKSMLTDDAMKQTQQDLFGSDSD